MITILKGQERVFIRLKKGLPTFTATCEAIGFKKLRIYLKIFGFTVNMMKFGAIS